MTLRATFAVSLVLSLAACTNQPAADNPVAAEEVPASKESTPEPEEAHKLEKSDAEVWVSFVSDWNAGDAAQLKKWSAPLGVLLLENPGAFTRMSALKDVPALHQMPGGMDGARVATSQLKAEIDEGPIPQVSCEEESIPKGIFLGPSDGAFLLKQLDAEKEYQIASPEEIEKKRPVAEAAAAAAKFMVYDGAQHFKFLFGVVDGQMRLLAVNAVVPCSA